MRSKVRITYWRHIPSMIVVSGDGREIKTQLPPRFQQAIDAYAMAVKLTGAEEYMAEWKKGPWFERDGTPEEVSQAVLAELEAEFAKIEIPKRNG